MGIEEDIEEIRTKQYDILRQLDIILTEVIRENQNKRKDRQYKEKRIKDSMPDKDYVLALDNINEHTEYGCGT